MYKNICGLLLILSTPTLYTAEKTFTHCYYTTSNMLITIDEGEKDGLSKDPTKISAVSWALFDALQDTCSIIVASNHLLNNIGYFSNPNQKDWDARKLSENISVLVPKQLFTEYRTRGTISADVDDDHVLGIYFSRYKLLEQTDLTNETIGKKKLSLEATDALLELFIPRTEYFSRWKGSVLPRNYNLLFFAHGLEPIVDQTIVGDPIESEGRVAGFLTQDMNKLLFILPKTVTFDSVTILSCKAGDVNQLAILSKNHGHLADARSLPFPVTISTPLAVEVRSLGTTINFRAFYDELTAHCDHPDYIRALSYLYKSTEINIAIIKYPGLPVFFPLDPTKYGEIGIIMGATRTAPLAIPSYFKKKQLLAVLIHAPKIDFQIILDPELNPIPLFFSAEPGPRIHQFTGGFDARSYPLSRVIKAFSATQQFEWKAFTFSTITAQDDVINKNNQVQEFKNVTIINHLEYQKAAPDPAPESGPKKPKLSTNQKPVVLVTYALNDQTFVFEKRIERAPDAQTLGEEIIKNTIPLTSDTQKDVQVLIESITKMAQNPTLVNPDLLVPQIEQVSKFLAKHVENKAPGWSTNRLLRKFAKSLKILAETERV